MGEEKKENKAHTKTAPEFGVKNFEPWFYKAFGPSLHKD